jgi:hypothetical protein
MGIMKFKTIILPRNLNLNKHFIPTPMLGFYKPHQICHVLDYKNRPTNTYIKITHISRAPASFFPIKGAKDMIELIQFKIVYKDEFFEEDQYGNIIVKVFN